MLLKDKFLLIILLLAGVLLFANLGNIYLWQDEAETALLAKNILSVGYPRAWDNKNIISQVLQEAELDFKEHFVWVWHPWLQFYVTAASFLFLGINTFSARFPFTLIGLISVIVFYFFSIRLTGNKTTARLSAILLITSIPFLLHARQCRWYMLAVFSTIWLLWSYLKLQNREKYSLVQFIISSVILFYSNYLIFFGTISGVFLHFLVFNLKKEKIKPIVVSGIWIFIFTFPWFIYAKIWSRSSPLEECPFSGLEKFIVFFKIYSTCINSYIFPLVFILVLFTFWVFLKRKGEGTESDKQEIFLIFIPICTTIVILFFMKWIYFRYLITLVPLSCLLLGIIIGKIREHIKPLAYFVLVLLIFTNVFSLVLPPYKLKFDFLNYLYEITHNYDGPNEGIVKFLLKNGNSNQVVKINYGQMPIIFYTDMTAIGWPQDLRIPIETDWIIIRKDRGFINYLKDISKDYLKFTIDYPDIPWGNRPDPFYHKYRTVTGAENIVIYKLPILLP